MFKRFAAGIFLLAVMCGVSYGATEYDPFNLHFWYTSPDYEAQVYGRYGNTDYNFFYQLRDITGADRREQVAGPQWFATVYENYYYGMRRAIYGVDTDEYNPGIYRRTMGGEIPDITFSVVGDLLDGFNFVFAEEPQPYATAWRRYINREVYDVYPDPVESLCLVISGGHGEMNIDFGNPYARHFPFWWDFNTAGSSQTSTKWWLQGFDWRNETYPTLEPIAYIYSSPDLYVRDYTNNRYNKEYEYVVSHDYSADQTTVIATHVLLVDTSGETAYKVSGDEIYTADNVLAYIVSASRDKVYDASGDVVFTIETDSAGDMFICELRNINESIAFSGFDDGYTFYLNPSVEQTISSAGSLKTNVTIRGITPSEYGSRLGYISFRQRASLATGYTNYREITTLPLVIANVAEGNASENPLLFDMIVSDSNDNVVNRIKFTWDAQNDKPDQDLGTFFMIGSRDVTYKLETRITNRTGTRYELYRYDMTDSVNGNPSGRNGYNNIMPDYWTYDLTPDNYGTLPESFLLDAHSQIAPGLVTVYKNNIGEGYRTISTENDTSESFRLYEYASGNPKNLRLKYRRIGGMTPIEGGTHTPSSGVNVREFSMKFVDVASNANQTAEELYILTGKLPAMIGVGPLISDTSRVTGASYGDDADPASVVEAYPHSAAIDAFRITKAVPEGLVRLASEDTGSDDTSTTTSGDQSTTSGDTGIRGVSASEVIYTSLDIPLQPIAIRMRVPRLNSLIADHWDEMNNAENSEALFNIFARYGTVWVRSDATAEKDANLFSAINNKGSNIGKGAKDCVRAFICNDELCLDFIVIMADGVSKTTGKTAYVEIFEDDNVPYILIGDGKEDGKWDLTFYIAASSETDDSNGIANRNGTTSNDKSGSNSKNSSGTSTQGVGGGSGGGGCNISGMIAGLMLLGISLLAKKH